MNPLIEIALISFFCMGWYTISYDGMVLEPLRLWVDSKLPSKGFLRALYTPIWGCPICYSSFWGGILHLFVIHGSIIMLLPMVVSVAFVNSMLLSVKYKLEK
jgi:hypothetical protein